MCMTGRLPLGIFPLYTIALEDLNANRLLTGCSKEMFRLIGLALIGKFFKFSLSNIALTVFQRRKSE